MKASSFDRAAETIAESRELIRTSHLLIASARETVAASKRLCQRHVGAGVFDPPTRAFAWRRGRPDGG